MNQKGLAPILIVVLIAVALVGGHFIYTNYSNNRTKTVSQNQISTSQTPQPTPSAAPDASPAQNGAGETANWKTYTDKDLGFEISYPGGWYAVKHVAKVGFPDLNRKLLLLFGEGPEPTEIQPLTHPWPDLNLEVSKIQFSSQELQKREIEQGAIIEGEPLNKQQYTPIEFMGIPANKKIQLTPELIDGNLGTRIIFNTKGYGWSFNYPAIDYQGNSDPIYDQILSTFKFLP